MSKKYVPSFLKQQTQLNVETEQKKDFIPASNNRFSVLSDDFSKPNHHKEVAPATLASLTSTASIHGNTENKSYAAKFSEKFKNTSGTKTNVPHTIDTSSTTDFPTLGGGGGGSGGCSVGGTSGSKVTKQPPKNNTIDISSDIDFPTLGSSSKVGSSSKGVDVTTTSQTITKNTTKVGNFAEMAKSWAKKDQEDSEAQKLKQQMLERQKMENNMIRKGIIYHRRIISKRMPERPKEDEEYNQTFNEDELSENDDYEVPEFEDNDLMEDDENSQGSNLEDEFNSNIGKARRHNDDLY